MSNGNNKVLASATVQDANDLNVRSGNFKATIIISSVYAALCLGIVLVAIFSRTGRDLLAEKYFPFVFTFVLAIIGVVVLLLLQVMAYTPPPKTLTITTTNCPDYYNTERVNDTSIVKIKDDFKTYAGMRCVPDSTIYPNLSSSLLQQPVQPNLTLGTNVTNDARRMVDQFNSGGIGGTSLSPEIAMNCSAIYPAYTAMWDLKNYPDAPNSGRCELAKQCGITWSAVCPSN